jgi:ribosomal protein S18 acetylase RimI-like enzyme
MHKPSSIQATAPVLTAPYPRGIDVSAVRLPDEDKREVLEFLALRPLHTVALVSLIRDNGLISPLNRGTFYGCRNRNGQLEGVALIGHATLMETTTDPALEAFAGLASKCTSAHLIMGEKQRIEDFWNYYAEGGKEIRVAARELLLELRWPVEIRQEVSDLRRATVEDLDVLLPIHAQLAMAESGVNPMDKDPEGFRQRYARRIEQGRTWIWADRGELIFKAEVFSETPEVIYLEGVWVNPILRGRQIGLRCMAQLAQNLLRHTQSLSLLVNETNTAAALFYKRAGYKLRGIYDTIFLS